MYHVCWPTSEGTLRFTVADVQRPILSIGEWLKTSMVEDFRKDECYMEKVGTKTKVPFKRRGTLVPRRQFFLIESFTRLA